MGIDRRYRRWRRRRGGLRIAKASGHLHSPQSGPPGWDREADRSCDFRLSRLLGARVDLLRLALRLRSRRFGAGADVDAPRLQLLRYLAHQVDHEQTVFDIRTSDLHMVSQIEALLETQRYALMKQLRLLALLTRDQERSPMLNQFDFFRGKAGDGHGDPILVFAF